jgi:alpha-mannosidase
VLQHVLLSTRKSIAWNPEYWFKVEGNHRYQMALLPHRGNWRLRYREGIEFNYPLVAFLGGAGSGSAGGSLPHTAEFLKLSPSNLILTAMKKSEEEQDVVIRFYEAEGRQSLAKVVLFKAIKKAWKTNLIEEEPEALPVKSDGSLELKVAAWEIVTIKLAV